MFTSLILLLVVEFLLLSYFTYSDQYSWNTTAVLTGVALYATLINHSFLATSWAFISTNIGTVIGLIVLYLVLGVAWSFFKWYVHLKRYIRRNPDTDSKYFRLPKAEDNKGRIIGWMSYWPISIPVYLLSDWVHNLYLWLFRKVSGVYNKITDGVLKSITKDKPTVKSDD